MNKFKVYFDYEEEDAVEQYATGPEHAKKIVASKLVKEHVWCESLEDIVESLNVKEVVDK